jgi:hypothetical protein
VFNVGSIASVLVVPSQSSVRNLHDALAGRALASLAICLLRQRNAPAYGG